MLFRCIYGFKFHSQDNLDNLHNQNNLDSLENSQSQGISRFLPCIIHYRLVASYEAKNCLVRKKMGFKLAIVLGQNRPF